MPFLLKNNFEKICQNLINKKILITGASGYVGQNLIEILSNLDELHKLNLHIYGISRNLPGGRFYQDKMGQKKLSWVSHDILNPIAFDLDVNYVIHAGAPVLSQIPDARKLFDTIVTGTKNVLEFAQNNKAQSFLNLSSGAVYGIMPDNMKGFTEDSAEAFKVFDERNPYGSGKRAVETLIKTAQGDISLTSARCFAFSGRHLPLDKHFAMGNFVGSVVRGEDIQVKGDGSSVRSYLDSEDMVFWLLTILFSGHRGESYNVGSDQSLSIRELAETVARFGKNTQVKIQNKMDTNQVNRYFPNVSKAKHQLGLDIKITLSESIQRMIDFQKEKSI